MQGPNYPHLARQFAELWQKQLSTVFSDREFLQSMMEMMGAMQMPGSEAAYARKTAATADPALAPDALRERLDGLDYRLRMLERRIAALESGAGGSDGSVPPQAGGSPKRRGKKPV